MTIKLPPQWQDIKTSSDAMILASDDPVDFKNMLRSVSHPKLDKLRAEVCTLSSSDLIVMITNADSIAARLDIATVEDNCDIFILTGAGMVSASDELDRRVPIKTK